MIPELVMEFTGDQMEMIKETVVEAITGTIMVMIAELTRDWIGDWIRNQSEMISELVSELVSELDSELIPELISDPDGCPLTGVHWKAQLLYAEPDNGVVYAITSGMNCARYCTSPRNFWTSL